MAGKKILYLFNPQSNSGNATKIWQKMRVKSSFLPEAPVDLTKVDLSPYIQEQNPDVIAIAGGDGSINSVCTVVAGLKRKPVLSIIPMGFGNAIAYCLGVETIDKALKVLHESTETVTIDLMRTNIKGQEIGVFNISLGFDANIVYHRQNLKYIGLGSYVLSAFRSLVLHPEKEITVTIDHNVTLEARASSLVIANCPIIGQNYVISPSAKFNDALLDCTLFSSKYAYLANLRWHGFRHPLYTELGKVRFKAKHLKIEGEPFIQVDGDPIVQQDKIEIEILPSQVTFLRNKQKAINGNYSSFIIK